MLADVDWYHLDNTEAPATCTYEECYLATPVQNMTKINALMGSKSVLFRWIPQSSWNIVRSCRTLPRGKAAEFIVATPISVSRSKSDARISLMAPHYGDLSKANAGMNWLTESRKTYVDVVFEN